VRVRTTEAARLDRVRGDWSKLPKVDQVLADFEWSERLGRWVRFGDRILFVAWLLLGAGVAFIVGHLIRLQVLTHREEIEVSQLVGATAADIRRPFLYHGILQGLLGGLLAVAAAAGLAAWAGLEMRALAPSYATELKVVFLPPIEYLAVVLAAGTLGFVGSWVAVGRELRQFSRGA